ncbi:MAG: hypothetical protein NZM12_08420 [Steroidobacteraceae bacterium]|nr:hypothetical protein [Steroidobacteraceae bacterium]MDW8258915.1 hypothetical protein [Gammaproteobacteria bacterium]
MAGAPTRVLALDLGAATGWARFANGQLVGHGVRRLPAGHRHPGEPFHAFGIWLKQQIAEFSPEVIAFEEPFHNTYRRGHAASRSLLGYRALLLALAFAAERRVWPVEPHRIKLATCGWLTRKNENGIREHAKARHVLEAVRARHPAVQHEDEAIAITVGTIAVAEAMQTVQP